jgi:hypothetical protein
LHASGKEIPVDISLTHFETIEGQFVSAAVRDVSKIIEASEYARTLLEASLDPLVTINFEGKITDLNEASVKITGIDREELLGTNFSDYFTEPDKANQAYQKVFEIGFVADYPLTIKNINGQLAEKEITREKIKTFWEICKDNIEKSPNDLNKLVYSRRLYELNGDKSLGYQLIANLFHKREQPTIRQEMITVIMTLEEIASAENEIREKIAGFAYNNFLATVTNDQLMIELYKSTLINYEKLHIYRIIFKGKTSLLESDAIRKFVNESFHIENNYIYQLNPCEYQTVPQYIINECDKHIELLGREN